MSNGWTTKRRERQSELIRQWKPWINSTGPKTTAGKIAVAKNAKKDQFHLTTILSLKQLLIEQSEFLDSLLSSLQ